MTTITLDLPVAEVKALRAIAEAPADVRAAALAEAQRVLRRAADEAPADEAPAGGASAPELRGYGMLAGLPGSVDEFLQGRHEEARAEERQYQERVQRQRTQRRAA